jgi:hypothetical protein
VVAVPSRHCRRGSVRCASVQRKKMIRERGGLGGLHGPVWLLCFFPLFFSEFFSSSFCYRISGKRKNGERDRLRKISKQVLDI